MSGRKWFLLSMLVCVVVSIAMVYLGLFSHPPLSHFAEEENFTLRDTKKDVRATLSRWNPQYIRAQLFRADSFDGFDRFASQLYVEILYYPGLLFRGEKPDFFPEKSQPFVLRFRDRFYLEKEQTLGFRVKTNDSYSLQIDGVPRTGSLQTYSPGHHTFDLWVYHPAGVFDLVVDYTEDESAFVPYQPGAFSAFTRRFGADRTAFSIETERLFHKGEARLTTEASDYLEELWFWIDEGRYWGRIVIEVHNKDGGLALSQQRALVLSRWLVEKGSPKKQITVQGHAGNWLDDQEKGRVEWVLLH